MLIVKEKNSGKERRNFYRILNVQPDASLEMIKNNYRTLLQKLRLHPDLGGKNWNASLINEAYNVLRNPDKRALYDKTLLKRYAINRLSRGNLEKRSIDRRDKIINHKNDPYGNQRNFYRLFNIQPDSPRHIIKTSYLTLKKNPNIPKELLNEGYSILSNSDKRSLYDRLILQYSHAEALNKISGRNQHKPLRGKVFTPALATARVSRTSKFNGNYLKKKYTTSNESYYQPVITQFCTFCKTPHNQSPCKDTAPLCNECGSPLFPPSKSFLEQTRRNIVRINQDSKIYFYTYWPEEKRTGIISDISPTGVQLVSSTRLNKDQIIKLDGKDFKAVGIVSYHKKNTGYIGDKAQISGIKFLTVNFNKSKGQFLSESA
jgi:curved DNA-binding protein CbpA